jgi:hypothetical protein
MVAQCHRSAGTSLSLRGSVRVSHAGGPASTATTPCGRRLLPCAGPYWVGREAGLGQASAPDLATLRPTGEPGPVCSPFVGYQDTYPWLRRKSK